MLIGSLVVLVAVAVIGWLYLFPAVDDPTPPVVETMPAPIAEEEATSTPLCEDEVRCISEEAISTERNPAPPSNDDVLPGYATGSGAQYILESINATRYEHGLKPLARNKRLDQSALLKRNDMVLKGYFAHNDPNGVEPWQFMDKAGYVYTRAAENLASEIEPRNVVQRWLASPTHKANVLLEDATEMGLYVGTDYIVLHLGSRDN